MKKKQTEVLIHFEGDEVVYTIKGVTYREKATKQEVVEMLEEIGFAVKFEDREH